MADAILAVVLGPRTPTVTKRPREDTEVTAVIVDAAIHPKQRRTARTDQKTEMRNARRSTREATVQTLEVMHRWNKPHGKIYDGDGKWRGR